MTYTSDGSSITNCAAIPIQIETCTNLADGAWQPLKVTNLVGGSLDFFDAGWTNHPSRIYRIAAP